MGTIVSFHGTSQFLSNFAGHPCVMDGWEYPTVEHAFAAAKTLDHEKRALIQEAPGPREAKALGRSVKLRPRWDVLRREVMWQLLCSKFNDPDAILSSRLCNTWPNHLVEGNTWHDNYWGDCHCGNRTECRLPGENWLGKLLMGLRGELQAGRTGLFSDRPWIN